MEDVRIYLSGGMSGLGLDDQLIWRCRLESCIKNSAYDVNRNPMFFNPPMYYSPSTNDHKSEKEAMEFELNKLRRSDLVVVNFNVPKSIGTAMELAIARERRIPIIGLHENKKDILHPWLVECCARICDDFDELVQHIVTFYLN